MCIWYAINGWVYVCHSRMQWLTIHIQVAKKKKRSAYILYLKSYKMILQFKISTKEIKFIITSFSTSGGHPCAFSPSLSTCFILLTMLSKLGDFHSHERRYSEIYWFARDHYNVPTIRGLVWLPIAGEHSVFSGTLAYPDYKFQLNNKGHIMNKI